MLFGRRQSQNTPWEDEEVAVMASTMAEACPSPPAPHTPAPQSTSPGQTPGCSPDDFRITCKVRKPCVSQKDC